MVPSRPVGAPSSPRSLYVDSVASKLINHRCIQLLHRFKITVGTPWVSYVHPIVLETLKLSVSFKFDISDAEFTKEALRLAPSCPLLLFSMLATACMYQSRFEPDVEVAHELAVEADDFHERCVSFLLPMLHDHGSITDGAFLACSTILRFYEEISGMSSSR